MAEGVSRHPWDRDQGFESGWASCLRPSGPGSMMMDSGWRVDRLADQIRSEVAGMIAANLKDPRIGFTTVTRVELSHDLRHARVWVSVLGDEAAQRRTLEALSSATGYVRHEVSHRLRLRRVPDLIFVLDRSPEEASRIETLLQDLRGSQK